METQICPGLILAINLQKRSISIIKLKKDHLHGKSLSGTFHSSHEGKSSLAELSMQMSHRNRVNMERLHFYIWKEAPGRLASVLSETEPEAIAVARIETSCTFPFGETELLCNISRLAFLWQLEPELNGL